MNRNDNNPDLPVDLAEVAALLRDAKPRAEAIELDRMKRRAIAQASARKQGKARNAVMRSRLALTMVLALGLLTSGAGAGLAVSGLSGSGSAGVAQYGPTTNNVSPTTEKVLGTSNNNTTTTSPEAAETTRQVASNDSNQLPFTGYAAIPVLLVGIALLGLGVLMRRRSSGNPRNPS